MQSAECVAHHIRLFWRRDMEISLPLVRLQSHICDKIVVILQILLNGLHTIQNEIPSSLRLPVRTNIQINVLIVAVLGPVINASQYELCRLWLCAPHRAHHCLHGCQRYWLCEGCAGK